jgi:hypothetical protein
MEAHRMSTMHQNDYIAGGYVVTQPIRRPAHIAADLFPELLLSPTTCDNAMTLDVWGGETPRQWRDYGVHPDRIADLLAWIDTQYEQAIGMPNIFFSLATAQQFITDFFPPDTGWVILGLGLHRTLVDDFLADDQRSEQELHQSAWGITTLLARGTPLAAGGTILGHEILGSEAGFLHTWVCSWVYSQFVEEGFQTLGIRPNRWGKLDALADARQYANQGQRYDTYGVEVWLPWLIVRYP